MIFIIKIGIQLNLDAKIKHENKYEHNQEYVMNEKKRIQEIDAILLAKLLIYVGTQNWTHL